MRFWYSVLFCLLLSAPIYTQEFTSPRISEAYYASDGKVGSSNGTVRGIDSLREYFREALRTVRGLHLELLHVTRGLHGAVAIVYRRESGTVATEILRVDQGRVIRAEALYGVGTM